jgi:hypothetical protein
MFLIIVRFYTSSVTTSVTPSPTGEGYFMSHSENAIEVIKYKTVGRGFISRRFIILYGYFGGSKPPPYGMG